MFQVWEWTQNQSAYHAHMYITIDNSKTNTIETKKFSFSYRALKRNVLNQSLEKVGFQNIKWLMPEESGFYQPIVIAQKK